MKSRKRNKSTTSNTHPQENINTQDLETAQSILRNKKTMRKQLKEQITELKNQVNDLDVDIGFLEDRIELLTDEQKENDKLAQLGKYVVNTSSSELPHGSPKEVQALHEILKLIKHKFKLSQVDGEVDGSKQQLSILLNDNAFIVSGKNSRMQNARAIDFFKALDDDIVISKRQGSASAHYLMH